MSVKFSEKELNWAECSIGPYKRFLGTISAMLLIKPFKHSTGEVLEGSLTHPIYLRGEAKSSQFPSLIFRLSILALPKQRLWILWDWDLELYHDSGVCPFNPVHFLWHFGKEMGNTVYGLEENALNAKEIEKRIWKLGCPNDLMALFREYDRVAKFYTTQHPIFNLD